MPLPLPPVLKQTIAGKRTQSEQTLYAGPLAPSGVHLLLINFNTAMQTRRCLEAVQATCSGELLGIHLLDNSQDPTTLQTALNQSSLGLDCPLWLYVSRVNSGFAEGSNWLIEQALNIANCDSVLLLNNDAVLCPGGLHALSVALCTQPMAGLAGARVHQLNNPQTTDSLGVALFASLMPADRKDSSTPYVGPTGGCCLMTRAFLMDLKAIHGYWFDARFFCYCEDVDLVLRARWLGYEPLFVDQVVALHEGQASSGGGYNDFILYHGLRNSLWMAIKCLPRNSLLRFGLPLLWAHCLAIGHYTLRGKLPLLFRVYRDGVRGMPATLRLRSQVHKSRRCRAASIDALICRRFYRDGYIKEAWRRLLADLRSLVKSTRRS